HDAVSRFVDVRGAVRGRGPGSVERDVRRRLDGISFPLAYNAELLEPPDDSQGAGGQFLSLAIAAAIGALLLPQAAFGRWRLAFLVFCALPAALIGGLLAVAADGGFSLGAAAGLYAVFALAARNSVALIATLRRLELAPGATSADARPERS